MSLEDDVNKLKADIKSIDECINCLEIVKSGNHTWCHENFEYVLNCYLETRNVLKVYGVEINSLEYGGLNEIEILVKCLENAQDLISTQKFLSGKLGILSAELRVQTVLSKQLEILDEDTPFLGNV